MIPYDAMLLDPLYRRLGILAWIVTAASRIRTYISVIDKTAGEEFTYGGGGGIDVATVRPAADVRVLELDRLGITRDELVGGTLELNGTTWRIESTHPRPKPGSRGELRLWLMDAGT